MKRIKDNIMLIILSVVIIICSLCICNKIDSVNEWLDNIRYELGYKASDSSIKTLKLKLDEVDKKLHNIDLTLDGSLDDILYYMPKNR